MSELKNRIEALSPEAKKLFLKKLEFLVNDHQAKQNHDDQRRLVAYIQEQNNLNIESLTQQLKQELPNYMVPAKLIPVKEMPLLPNGKVDRNKLSTLNQEPTIKATNTHTRNTAAEQQLITIWQEVLGFAPITKTDNFFEIGGDSISSIQIVAKAKKTGIQLHSNALFENQTIEALASTVNTALPTNDNQTIEVEKKLILIWEEVLGFAPITKTDNFFEIGGDSILSIQIVAKAKKEGIELDPNALFEHQTIKELCSSIPVVQPNTQANEVACVLITVWEEVLGFAPITDTDNFFEIGGDSILSIQIVAKAKKEGIELDPNALFEHQTIKELSDTLTLKQNNSFNNHTETVLTAIWEKVLGFAPITNTDNFFEIGGDSILSIQIIAEARKNGILLNANDIFEHQTIAELKEVTKTTHSQNTTSAFTGKTALTPIQHWFFRDHKNAPNYWNQALKLDNIPSLTEDKVNAIMLSLITAHDTLRSSFIKKDNHWEAQISPPEASCALNYIDVSALETSKYESFLEQQITKAQNEFDLSKGSLFKCIYCYSPNASFCVLLAHHLVVDAVSWQIIIDHFIEGLTGQIDSNTKTATVNDWVQFLEEKSFEGEIEYWKSQIETSPKLPYDLANTSIIEEKDIVTNNFSLTQETTKRLKTDSNKLYNTKIEELLSAAFVGTINEWGQLDEISIGFEKHGRETTLNTDIDLSKTVGWLTAYYPVKFKNEYQTTKDISKLIISTKESIRKIPNGGVGYGVLRYLKKVFGNIGSPEIVFNYLGTLNFNNHNTIKVSPVTKNLRATNTERTYKFEVNTYIKEDQLYCDWSYSKKMYTPETIDLLIEKFKQKLNLIVDHCNENSSNQTYTPSDFTEVDISQDDLDNLLDFLD